MLCRLNLDTPCAVAIFLGQRYRQYTIDDSRGNGVTVHFVAEVETPCETLATYLSMQRTQSFGHVQAYLTLQTQHVIIELYIKRFIGNAGHIGNQLDGISLFDNIHRWQQRFLWVLLFATLLKRGLVR